MAWSVSHLLGNLVRRSRTATWRGSRRGARRVRLETERLEPRCVPSLTTLVSFDGGIDGKIPGGGVVVDASGDIFGTTLSASLSANQSTRPTISRAVDVTFQRWLRGSLDVLDSDAAASAALDLWDLSWSSQSPGQAHQRRPGLHGHGAVAVVRQVL